VSQKTEEGTRKGECIEKRKKGKTRKIAVRGKIVSAERGKVRDRGGVL